MLLWLCNLLSEKGVSSVSKEGGPRDVLNGRYRQLNNRHRHYQTASRSQAQTLTITNRKKDSVVQSVRQIYRQTNISANRY